MSIKWYICINENADEVISFKVVAVLLRHMGVMESQFTSNTTALLRMKTINSSELKSNGRV